MSTDVASTAIWTRPPFLQCLQTGRTLPCAPVRFEGRPADAPPPPWIDTGAAAEPFNFSRAMSALLHDISRHVPEFGHIRSAHVLVTFLQARNQRRHGLQARVTPLRFAGGQLVRQGRGRLFQVQRLIVDGHEILYLMTFSLPRFLNQSFDDKMVTVFHELYHIGPNFDGDLRRHRGRCSLHTTSKRRYDERMSGLARQYLASGAHQAIHGFLRLNFAQLAHRHGRVIGVKIPRLRILPVPLEVSQACHVL